MLAALIQRQSCKLSLFNKLLHLKYLSYISNDPLKWACKARYVNQLMSYIGAFGIPINWDDV